MYPWLCYSTCSWSVIVIVVVSGSGTGGTRAAVGVIVIVIVVVVVSGSEGCGARAAVRVSGVPAVLSGHGAGQAGHQPVPGSAAAALW